MNFDPQKITFFAKTDARGANVPFGIKAIDRTKHMYVIGKTGMGKSTLLENMAVQDIANGEGMAFIDPHGQTAETLLDYIPEHRKDDVLYFAPFDTNNPVAFNVMEDVGPDRRHLVVSGLMSVFKKIWLDAWSARMEYILQNTLLALLEYPDSTLLGVNRMLSEKHYRKKVIDNISDPAVKAFWVDEFLNYNERYMQEAGDAIKNKIGQFTANPLIRNIIGQPKSSFDLRQIMDERKILIMNLSKGLVGESNANLLGSMLTTRIYLAAMSRADVSVVDMKEMPNFYFYVDEFQSFANATFADILSEARKYKLNLTIAHQYIEQMEEEVRNAVFGNVGTIASFRVGPFDAEVLETIFSPQFLAVDICNLGFAQIYLTLMIDGIGSRPFSATTLPPIQPKSESCKQIVIHRSRAQFAKERAVVEQEINDWMAPIDRSGGKNEGTGNNKNAKRPERDGAHKRRNEAARPERPPRREGGGSVTQTNTNERAHGETQKSEKSLNDLRSVLQTLAKPESEKGDGNNRSHQSVENQGQRNESRGEQKSSERQRKNHTEKSKSDSRPKNDAKKTEPAQSVTEETQSPVKQALADVLATVTKPTQSKEGLATKPLASKQDPVAAPSNVAPAEASQVSVRQSQPKPATPAVNTSPEVKPEEQTKADDPLDPKLLERMMRVTTSDKTPLK